MTSTDQILKEIRAVKKDIADVKQYLYTDEKTGQDGIIARMEKNERRLITLERLVSVSLSKATVGITILSAIGSVVIALILGLMNLFPKL